MQDFTNMQICRKFKEPCKEMQSNMQITNTFQIAQLCACKADQGQVQMGSCWDANSGKEGARRLMPPSNSNRNHWNKDIDMCKYHFTFCKLKTPNIWNFLHDDSWEHWFLGPQPPFSVWNRANIWVAYCLNWIEQMCQILQLRIVWMKWGKYAG